ncbi:unnamed protein product, partial [Nesidiocoris tenuis]
MNQNFRQFGHPEILEFEVTVKENGFSSKEFKIKKLRLSRFLTIPSDPPSTFFFDIGGRSGPKAERIGQFGVVNSQAAGAREIRAENTRSQNGSSVTDGSFRRQTAGVSFVFPTSRSICYTKTPDDSER